MPNSMYILVLAVHRLTLLNLLQIYRYWVKIPVITVETLNTNKLTSLNECQMMTSKQLQ